MYEICGQETPMPNVINNATISVRSHYVPFLSPYENRSWCWRAAPCSRSGARPTWCRTRIRWIILTTKWINSISLWMRKEATCSYQFNCSITKGVLKFGLSLVKRSVTIAGVTDLRRGIKKKKAWRRMITCCKIQLSPSEEKKSAFPAQLFFSPQILE